METKEPEMIEVEVEVLDNQTQPFNFFEMDLFEAIALIAKPVQQ